MTADVEAAFLRGEAQDTDRVLYCWLPRVGPRLPHVASGSILFSLKGGRRSRRCWKTWDSANEILCLGLFTLHHRDGALADLMSPCGRRDDMLGTGGRKELDKIVGFGSAEPTTSCSVAESTKNAPCPWRHTFTIGQRWTSREMVLNIWMIGSHPLRFFVCWAWEIVALRDRQIRKPFRQNQRRGTTSSEAPQ